MKYILNGKTIKIDDKEIESLMSLLNCTKEEALDTWLCDHEYDTNEEQVALDNVARNVEVNTGASKSKNKPSTKPRTPKKVSDEKKNLFSTILASLEEYDTTVANDNKLIEVTIGEKHFKVNITESRPKK